MWLRTGALMAVLTAILVGIGYLIGGPTVGLFMFAISMLINFITYWFSDSLVLKWYRARIVAPEEAPYLYSLVQELAQKANLPVPKVAIVPSPTPNAFATGRNPEHAVVAVTEGIIHLLSREELKAVLGHEMTHIKHRDMLIGTLAAALAGAIMQLGYWGRWALIFAGGDDDDSILGLILVAVVAPIAALMVQMAISRSREYLADEGGAMLSGEPAALARALRKIENGVRRRPMNMGSPATAHMFIVNPFRGSFIMNLFSTHPPTEKRIENLKKVARKMGKTF
ncbi:MAG: M48 family metalloprotease [Euryarchaeota archaeon]|nr:M48 family metalloprotease [Euryarchaeota archaeon]